ncbi:alternate-type signal peptide domain-containing protein [Gordonia phthalatica]|uniref:Alternate-type signal peptide domain-containing protein n=1 Tax=Gordonia phthalatica TaxID=1136941 RepID=A0A0N9N7S1_9ACTN|nr:alternate-type signal peptide domain-containing protein [Gordonia phthalatica]ALG84086.1 hypothetical protein ACH46_05660 [Gordonia phthalatica]
MNRKTKGALALGAGAIILLGGAGSFALWSDTSDIADGQVVTGDFNLECDAGGTWTDISNDTLTGPTITPTTDFMVPGDTWKYAAMCTPTFTGKNIKATLAVDLAGTTVPSNNFAVTSTVNGVDSTTTPFTASSGSPVPVTVTVEFKSSTSGTADAGHQTVSVAGMTITLQQVRPS